MRHLNHNNTGKTAVLCTGVLNVAHKQEVLTLEQAEKVYLKAKPVSQNMVLKSTRLFSEMVAQSGLRLSRTCWPLRCPV